MFSLGLSATTELSPVSRVGRWVHTGDSKNLQMEVLLTELLYIMLYVLLIANSAYKHPLLNHFLITLVEERQHQKYSRQMKAMMR